MIRYKYIRILLGLMFFSIPALLFAQSTPGGVLLGDKQVLLWLSADRMDGASTALLAEGASIASWKDRGGLYNFVKNGSQITPIFTKKGMNYAPAVEFPAEGSNYRKLISETSFINNTDGETYYVFHVSKANRAAIGTSQATVFAFGPVRYEYDGWQVSSGKVGAWSQTRTSASAGALRNLNLDKDHGVVASFRPNRASSVRSLFHNGTLSTTGSVNNTMSSRPTDKAIIGTHNTTGGSPFYGQVQEIIVIAAPKGSTVDLDFVNKINSYLAIKYGETLQEGQYLNSEGIVLWGDQASHAPTAAGYGFRVIGIGRDDAAGINQKQSRSSDKSFISIFKGATIKNLNTENSYNWPTDKEFYMFGSNGQDGYSEYLQEKETVYRNGYTLPSKINTRQKEIFLVNFTHPSASPTINIESHYQSADLLLVSSDNGFAPGVTAAYPVDADGLVKDVLLQDGDYLSFATFLPSPGGGDGLDLELWLAADQLSGDLPPEGGDVAQWVDMHGKSTFVPNATAGWAPSYTNYANNYQSAVSFSYNEDAASNQSQMKLVSTVNYITSANKAYYTFWVSKPDEETKMADGTVFRFGSNNNHGWSGINNQSLWTTSNTTSSANTINVADGMGNFGGIGAMRRPNTGGPSTLMFNGKAYLEKNVSRAGNNTSLTSIGTSSATASGTTNFFYGDVQEIIVYTSPNTAVVPIDDLQKIQSYLAIKYSYTLEEGNYLSSGGKVVWDRNQADYNDFSKAIFGVGRDHNSALNQRQSMNPGKKMLSLFVGDKLEETNAANQTRIVEDQSFFILGGNNGLGTKTYIHKEGTTYSNGTRLHKDVTKLDNRVFKAKITGDIKVGLYVHMSIASAVLVSADLDFDPVTTKAFNVGESYGHSLKDIDVKDGEYVAIVFAPIGPGGVVDNLRLWLKADEGIITGFGSKDVLEWQDQSEIGNNYMYNKLTTSKKTQGKFIANDSRMNFNPTLNLEEAYSGLAIKEGPISMNAPNAFTSFVVYNQTMPPLVDERLYTHGFGGTNTRGSASRSPAMGFSPGKGGGRIYLSASVDGNGAGTGQEAEGFQRGATALAMIQTLRTPGAGEKSITFDFGGWVDPSIASNSNNNWSAFKMASGGTIGGASLSNAQFQGIISEMIFYERKLSAVEKEQVQAYLAVKYGITLDKTRVLNNPGNNYDYLFSSGNDGNPSNMMWPGNYAPYNLFHTNVAGLVNDEASGSYNNKAKSSGPGAIMTVSVYGHTDLGQGEFGKLPNRSSIFWGHDKAVGELSFQGNDDICGEMDARLNKVWLFNKTALNNNLESQDLTIRVKNAADMEGVPGSGFQHAGPGYQLFLLVADNYEDLKVTGGNLSPNKWSQAIPSTYVDGEQEFNFKLTDKNTYFSFGYKQVAGAGCEDCEIEGIKRIAFTSKTWNRKGGPSQTITGDGFSADISVTTEGANLNRNYPRAVSKSLKILRRRGAKSSVITTTIVPSSAATASFELFEVDYRLLSYDNLEIYGLCEDLTEEPGAINTGSKSFPRLSYNLGEKKSSYRINNPLVTGIKRRSSYTHKRGRVQVDFEYPIKSIVIKHTATSKRSTSRQRFGIGNIDFLCIPPLPPANEDGLVFTKQGPAELLLCETVDYTFRVTNTNCEVLEAKFTDILPAGMYWVGESLSVPEEGRPTGADEELVTNAYDKSKNLEINNLRIPGGATLTFRASARFEDNAAAGDYANRASLSYPAIVNPAITKTLLSCDRLITSCEPTVTRALASTRQQDILTEITSEPTCYKEEGELLITMTIRNPNASSYSNAAVDFYYNEEFTYVPGSLVIASGLGSASIDTSEEGMISIEDLTLPAGGGQEPTAYTVTFKVKAPVKSSLIEEEDEQGNPIPMPGGQGNEYIPFAIEYGMFVESDDVCAEAAFEGANGELLLPYCLSKRAIKSNRNIRSRTR